MLGLGSNLTKGGAGAKTIVTDSLVLKHNYSAGAVQLISDGAASFNGTSDYIELGSDIDFNAKDFSVSAWYKTTDTSFRIIQTRNTGSGGAKAGWQISSTNGTDWANTYIEDASGNYMLFNSASMDLDDGNWHNITMTWDTSEGTGCLYADGSLLQCKTDTDMINGNINSSDSLIIGAANSGAHEFDGYICNAGIWDAVLSQPQIKSIMNKNYAGLSAGETASLVSWWNLDEETATDGTAGTGGVKDHEGSNHGTLS